MRPAVSGRRLHGIDEEMRERLLAEKYVSGESISEALRVGALDPATIQHLYTQKEYSDLIPVLFNSITASARLVDVEALNALMTYTWSGTSSDALYERTILSVVSSHPDLAVEALSLLLRPPLSAPHPKTIELMLAIGERVPSAQIELSKVYMAALPASKGVQNSSDQCLFGVLWFCAISDVVQGFVSYIGALLECIIRCGDKRSVSTLGGWVNVRKSTNPFVSQCVTQGVLEVCSHVQRDVAGEILPLLLCVDQSLAFDMMLKEANTTGDFESIARIVFFSIRISLTPFAHTTPPPPMTTTTTTTTGEGVKNEKPITKYEMFKNLIFFKEGEALEEYIYEAQDTEMDEDELDKMPNISFEDEVKYKASGKFVDVVLVLLCGWMSGFAQKCRDRQRLQQTYPGSGYDSNSVGRYSPDFTTHSLSNPFKINTNISVSAPVSGRNSPNQQSRSNSPSSNHINSPFLQTSNRMFDMNDNVPYPPSPKTRVPSSPFFSSSPSISRGSSRNSSRGIDPEDKLADFDTSPFLCVFGLFCYLLSRCAFTPEHLNLAFTKSDLASALLITREGLYAVSPYFRAVFRRFWLAACGDMRVLEQYYTSRTSVVINSKYPSPFRAISDKKENEQFKHKWCKPREIIFEDCFSEW